MTTWFRRGLSAAAVCVLAGCTGSDGMPPSGVLKGTVKYKGQPVPGGSVIVYPAGGGGRDGAGLISPDGRYAVYEAPLGAVKVVVRGVDAKTASAAMYPGQTIPKGAKVTGAPPEARMGGGGPPAKPIILPAKYAQMETTPLTFTVAKGDNTFDIELTD
jgi:hypothetical protein